MVSEHNFIIEGEYHLLVYIYVLYGIRGCIFMNYGKNCQFFELCIFMNLETKCQFYFQ